MELKNFAREDLLQALAQLDEPQVNANLNHPDHQQAAERIAATFAAENKRRHNDPDNKLPVIKGDHTPLSWCIQPDGMTLCVVLRSGPKIYGPLKEPSVADRAIQKAKQVAKAFENFASDDARRAALDQYAESLATQKTAIDEQIANIDATIRERIAEALAQAQVITPADGISPEEASAAGKALAEKKKANSK